MKLVLLALLAFPLWAEWTFVGTSQWEEESTESGTILRIHRVGKVPDQPVRRPAGIALLPGEVEGAFTFDVQAKSLDYHKRGADICVIFGYQDEWHFYYAHISNDSNQRVHTVIMKVDGATRTPIQRETAAPPALGGEWQHIRLVRKADGGIEVYVDDMDTPHLSALDKTWLAGRVGIGAFDDRAEFRDARLNR